MSLNSETEIVKSRNVVQVQADMANGCRQFDRMGSGKRDFVKNTVEEKWVVDSRGDEY